MVKLDIFSDPICPWCYIGKSYLDRALEKAGNHPFNIQWHPFQLNPEMPLQGVDRREYLERKFGNKDLAIKAYTPVLEHAALAGINLKLEKIIKTPNTLSAHRLIFWAWQEGVQNAVVSAIFKAYFVEGKDIGENTVLVDISHNTGIDKIVVDRLLKGTNDKEQVIETDKGAREMGINSAPTFILNGRHVITGAQNVDFWSNLINEVKVSLSI
ncbi:DsbA family oxidoreductase [Rhodobacteraceae bacterium]|nr:DsbA family oxidoreductase [Paracoccaceae bacterium]